MPGFPFFRKHRAASSNGQDDQDTLWDLWAEDRITSPYKELMSYLSEVNNGGHDQYFFNTENTLGTDALQKELSTLETVLSEPLRQNLQSAYRAYLDKPSKKTAEAVLKKCDDTFHENENDILLFLKEHAPHIER